MIDCIIEGFGDASGSLALVLIVGLYGAAIGWLLEQLVKVVTK